MIPVGTTLLYFGAVCPDGYLFCNGKTYNVSDYPELANFFGKTSGVFTVPDMSECTPVVVGQSARSMAVHEPLSLNEFRDDKIQAHEHSFEYRDKASTKHTGGESGTRDIQPYVANTIGCTGRIDDCTYGKSIGCNFIIKY